MFVYYTTLLKEAPLLHRVVVRKLQGDKMLISSDCRDLSTNKYFYITVLASESRLPYWEEVGKNEKATNQGVAFKESHRNGCINKIGTIMMPVDINMSERIFHSVPYLERNYSQLMTDGRTTSAFPRDFPGKNYLPVFQYCRLSTESICTPKTKKSQRYTQIHMHMCMCVCTHR